MTPSPLTEAHFKRLAEIRADNLKWRANGQGEDWDVTLLLLVIDRLAGELNARKGSK